MYVKENQVNFRTSPTIDAKLIRQLSKGTEAKVIEDKTDEVKIGKWKGHWTRVLIGEEAGWILDSFLTENISDTISIHREFEKTVRKYSRQDSCCKDADFQMYSERIYNNGDAGDFWREPAIFSMNLKTLEASVSITYVECKFSIIEISQVEVNTFLIAGIPRYCQNAQKPEVALKLQFSPYSAFMMLSGVSKDYADLSGKFLYGEPAQRRIFGK